MIYNIKKSTREMSHNNKSLKKVYSIANHLKVNILSRIKDEKFAEMKYKENTGLSLDLYRPQLYNEKIWWLKLNNRDPLLTLCSDKHLVRDYVKQHGLKHILIDTIGIYEKAEEIKFSEIKEKVIIKCTHGSGTNVIYEPNQPFNTVKFVKKFNRALRQNYYLQSREWNYKNIVPKLIVEKVIEDENRSSLIDYRFMCFNGEVKLILVDIDTMATDGSHYPGAKRNVYDKDFNLLDVTIGRENFNGDLVEKPKKLDDMISYAELLSKPFVHCRVDLYNVQEKIYFGEITFYPGGGTQRITPIMWDEKIGSWINISSEKVIVEENAQF